MSTVSFEFLVFFVVTLIAYYMVPHKTQWKMLLAAGMFFFCAASGPKLFCVFLVTCLINWIAAGRVHKGEQKILFVAVLVLDAALLIGYKNLNFFPETLELLGGFLGLEVHPAYFHIAAPLGISYYTLILMGYLVDVYWGKYEPEQNFFRFLLFAGYFPQMSSGPFVKYDVQREMLYQGKTIDKNRIFSGMERILWGFFKKLVVAERLAVMVNQAYDNPQVYGGITMLFALILFPFQLYMDFSGAMDIALGVSECFGIVLPENFNRPFLSRSIAEFWRRWHITLGEWLREYVFYPVLRSEGFRRLKKACKKKWGRGYEKKFDLTTYLGLFVTWFLIGFWHGGNWACILMGSGLYYWFLITMSEICTPLFTKMKSLLHINDQSRGWILWQRIRTFLLFCFGLSFFRAQDLSLGWQMWSGVLRGAKLCWMKDGTVLGLGLDGVDFAVAMISLVWVLVMGVWDKARNLRPSPEKSPEESSEEKSGNLRKILWLVMLLVVLIFGQYGVGFDSTSFIYQQF